MREFWAGIQQSLEAFPLQAILLLVVSTAAIVGLVSAYGDTRWPVLRRWGFPKIAFHTVVTGLSVIAVYWAGATALSFVTGKFDTQLIGAMALAIGVVFALIIYIQVRNRDAFSWSMFMTLVAIPLGAGVAFSGAFGRILQQVLQHA